MEMTPAKENIWRTAFLYPFRVLASLLSALSMDDNGFSLKKCLAVYGTYIAGMITQQHACKENAIAYVALWLAWVGILVGIYSIADISNAINSYKNKPDEKQNPPVTP